jgi:hypothetical protein
MTYDSTEDTQKHIQRVQQLIDLICTELHYRGLVHDKSKLESPEKEAFDEMTPKLKGCTYGSEEYKDFLKQLAPVLEHHYKNNSHHPEHYENGIQDMTLIDVLEMFCDFKAASERHADGDFKRSIEINSKRFNIDPQLVKIFENTRKAILLP